MGQVEWRTIESRLGTLSPSCVSRVPVPVLRGLGLYWRLMQDIETIMGQLLLLLLCVSV